jgi:hypothetical protein
MKVQKTDMIPSAIVRARNLSVRRARSSSPGSLDLLASIALTFVLVPVFLHFNAVLAIAIPLSLLIGLISQQLFRLVFNPVGNDVFFPTTLVVGYFSVDFAARSVYLSTVPFFARIGRNPYDDYLSAALWCACAGYVCFSAGMSSKIARNWLNSLPPVKEYWPGSIPALRLLAMMVVGLACLLYLFKNGQAVGNYANLEFQRHPPPGVPVLLENLLDLAWVAICIFLVAPGRKADRGLVWVLLGISLGTLCMRLAISGGKVALIQPLISAAIVFHYGKRRFRIWEMVVFGVPVLILAFGIVNFYRFVVIGHRGSPKSLSDVISRVSSASDLLSSKHDPAVQHSALEQMVERNAGVDALALIMKYTPRPFPYVYGMHWLEVPLTFVPRQIWKDKPINMPSAEFESTYMGEPPRFNGFSSMHLIADLYRNFSFPGVLCGMFLFGVTVRCIYLFCSPSPKNSTGLFLYASLFPEIIHALEADLGYAMINVTRAALLAVLVAFFLGGGYRRLRSRKVPFRPLGGADPPAYARVRRIVMSGSRECRDHLRILIPISSPQ